jgi:hypothetical protein
MMLDSGNSNMRQDSISPVKSVVQWSEFMSRDLQFSGSFPGATTACD